MPDDNSGKLMGVKQIPFNSYKAAETVALFIDLMLMLGLEVTRSMSVLTGSDCISLYRETTWVGWGGGGWNGSDKPEETVQDFDWMMRTNLHLSHCQQKEKAPIGGDTSERGVLRSTFCYRMLLLPDESGKRLIFGEYRCGEKFSFIFCIFLNIVLLCLSLWE